MTTRLTVLIEIFSLEAAFLQKLWRKGSEVLNHLLYVVVGRIRAVLAEKVKIGDELK